METNSEAFFGSFCFVSLWSCIFCLTIILHVCVDFCFHGIFFPFSLIFDLVCFVLFIKDMEKRIQRWVGRKAERICEFDEVKHMTKIYCVKN